MPKLTIGAKGLTQCVTQCMLNDYPGLSEVVHPSHCNLYVQNKHVKQSTAVLQSVGRSKLDFEDSGHHFEHCSGSNSG